MVWKQHKQCHDCKQHGFQLRFSATVPEITKAQSQHLAWIIGTDGLPGAVCVL
jgi:hypothetical protein